MALHLVKTTPAVHARAAKAYPINDWCRWHQALETTAAANMRAFFAWQRSWVRAIFGV